MKEDKQKLLNIKMKEQHGLCGICKKSLQKEFEELCEWRRQKTKKRTHINISLDHIYPKSKLKGLHWFASIENLQVAHISCNRDKADKVIDN